MSPSPDPPLDPELPAAIGRYEVRRLIGEGSMGRVLLAHDPVLDRDVAVKHLRDDLKIPREVRAGLLTRMRHEARAAARVAHPNLVVLHDMGEDEKIGLYLVFEYVEGPTLKQRITEGPMPPTEFARLARDLGAALSVAHDAGILHRDVKPENVILAKTGGKIADFGIARIPDSTLTHQGGLMGTPAYSAPETFRAGQFSPLSDQFSLAATLYEALSSVRAFPGDDAVSVAAKIAHESPEPFAATLGLSASVDAVFARALARQPADRFPSCAAFGGALADAVNGGPAALAGDARASGPSIPAIATPPADRGAEGTPLAPRPTDEPTRPRSEPAIPAERTTGQVLLGALVVAVTTALLVRAALRAAERPAEPPPPMPTPTHVASVVPPRPRPAPTSRPVTIHAAPTATATATATVDLAPDAGPAASSAPAVGAAAPSGTAVPLPSATGSAAGSAKIAAPPP